MARKWQRERVPQRPPGTGVGTAGYCYGLDMGSGFWPRGWVDAMLGLGKHHRTEDREEAVAKTGDLCGAGPECVGAVGEPLSACLNSNASSSQSTSGTFLPSWVFLDEHQLNSGLPTDSPTPALVPEWGPPSALACLWSKYVAPLGSYQRPASARIPLGEESLVLGWQDFCQFDTNCSRLRGGNLIERMPSWIGL